MSAKTKKIIYVSIIVILILAITIAAFPLIQQMMSPEFQQWLQKFVKNAGFGGVLALLAIQMLQIVVAFIPGEPVELVAGAMYGALGGLTICMLGILISSAAVFTIVKRIGEAKLSKTKLYPKIMQYSFLQKEEKLLALVFLLYLIPGTPKDMLVYICALTPIKLRTFLTVSTIARIPSVITSTMAGAAFSSGNIGLTLIIFAVTGVLGLLGIWYHNKKFGKN